MKDAARAWRRAVAALPLAALPAWSLAQTVQPPAGAARPSRVAALAGCDPCAVVPDRALDRVRGGYSGADGLRASFGIERATSVDGQLVASGAVNIQDLRNITVAQAEALRSVLSGFNLIQNGVDNRSIVNSTVLNAATNSLQFIRAGNLQTTLRDALTVPLGPR